MARGEATLCGKNDGKICKVICNVCNYFANLTCVFAYQAKMFANFICMPAARSQRVSGAIGDASEPRADGQVLTSGSMRQIWA
jgi:hypothetical protein